jgi:hypothetical protein
LTLWANSGHRNKNASIRIARKINRLGKPRRFSEQRAS